ncbi:hypothetical protein [Mesorhizobium sp. M0895]|uniref:hypothetical protein n=1 Tax=Mesorhizobium sp. M0895 TaxID=2957019 RepID=UPI0033399773
MREFSEGLAEAEGQKQRRASRTRIVGRSGAFLRIETCHIGGLVKVVVVGYAMAIHISEAMILMAEPDVPKITNRDLQIPHTYFNGFSINLSNADVGLLLLLNNQPASAVSMSFSTAKTLAKALGELISNLEKEAGREIMDIDYLGSVIERMQKSEK